MATSDLTMSEMLVKDDTQTTLTSHHPAQTALVRWQPQVTFFPFLSSPTPHRLPTSTSKTLRAPPPPLTFNPHFLDLIKYPHTFPRVLPRPDTSTAPVEHQVVPVSVASTSLKTAIGSVDAAVRLEEGQSHSSDIDPAALHTHQQTIITTSPSTRDPNQVASSQSNTVINEGQLESSHQGVSAIHPEVAKEEGNSVYSGRSEHPNPSIPAVSEGVSISDFEDETSPRTTFDTIEYTPSFMNQGQTIQVDEKEHNCAIASQDRPTTKAPTDFDVVDAGISDQDTPVIDSPVEELIGLNDQGGHTQNETFEPIEGNQEDAGSIASHDSLASLCTNPETEPIVIKMQVRPASPPARPMRLASPRLDYYEPGSSTPRQEPANLFARRSSSVHTPTSPATPHSYPAFSPAQRIPLKIYTSPQLVVPSPGYQDVRPTKMPHHAHSPYLVPPAPVRPPSSESEHSSHSSKRAEDVEGDEDTAKQDQWKVGKRPGFQGSFVKQEGAEGEGGKRKRTLHESINTSAERVLKRPFRAPKVILAKKNPSSTAGLPQAPRPMTIPHKPGSTAGLMRSLSPSKAAQLHITQGNKRQLNKPFRTPTRVTNQFTPPSSTSRTSASSTSAKTNKPPPPRPRISLAAAKDKPKYESDKDWINKLETRERMLREALKYINNPDQEEEVAESAEKWITVGREVVARLFKLAPKPDDLDQQVQPSLNPFGGNSSFGYDMAQSFPSMQYVPLSEEQKEFLRTVERNEEGDPVDAEGNLLMGDVDAGGYGAMPSRENTGYGTSYGATAASSIKSTVEVEPPEWSPASMLSQMGIDPIMLGWNAELEDWD